MGHQTGNDMLAGIATHTINGAATSTNNPFCFLFGRNFRTPVESSSSELDWINMISTGRPNIIAEGKELDLGLFKTANNDATCFHSAALATNTLVSNVLIIQKRTRNRKTISWFECLTRAWNTIVSTAIWCTEGGRGRHRQ